MAVKLNIAEEFSPMPIGRYEKNSNYSGERFRKEFLLPRFKDALESKDTLLIDLEGVAGLSSSFLEEAFGGLVEVTEEKPDTVLEVLRFTPEGTYFDPYIDNIKDFIRRGQAHQKP